LRLSAIRHRGNDAPSCQSSRDQPTLHQVYRCRTRRPNRWKTHDYLRNGRSTRLQLSNQGGLLEKRVRPLPSPTVDRSSWRSLRICQLQGAFLVGRRKRRTGSGDDHWRFGDWDPGLHAIQGPGDQLIQLPIRTVDTGYGIERWSWLSQGSPSGFHAVYGPALQHVMDLG